jgi:hypothetical protein
MAVTAEAETTSLASVAANDALRPGETTDTLEERVSWASVTVRLDTTAVDSIPNTVSVASVTVKDAETETLTVADKVSATSVAVTLATGALTVAPEETVSLPSAKTELAVMGAPEN